MKTGSYNINRWFAYRTRGLFLRPFMQALAVKNMHAGNPGYTLSLPNSIQADSARLLLWYHRRNSRWDSLPVCFQIVLPKQVQVDIAEN